jgi:protein SCO1/2
MMNRITAFIVLFAALAARAAASASEVGFEQRIGQQLPMAAVFTDGTGNALPLWSYFRDKPVVLVFDYFRCPELCSLVASGATDALRQLEASVGKEYSVVTVSVDPTDTPEMAESHEREDVRHYGRSGSAGGWHALVGKPMDIQALTAAAGFHYRYDSRSRQYAHPSGLVVVTPKGIVSSYFLGVDFPADKMASAIRRAAANKTGSSVFSLLFVCFQGGSPEGRYGSLIWTALSVSVALTLIAVFGGIAWMLRQERRQRLGDAGTP